MSSSTPEKEKGSMGTSVHELAAESNSPGNKTKETRLPGIPVYIVILSLVVGALAIVTIPLGLIISDSSMSSVSDLSRIIMNQAVDGTVNQIQGVLDQPADLLNALLKSRQLIKTVSTNNNNLRADVETYLFMESLMNSSPYVSGINCITYPNLFATNPPSVNYPNVTMLLTYRDPEKVLLYYADWSTGPYSRFSIYDPNYGYTYTYTFGWMVAKVFRTVWVPEVSKSHPAFTCAIGFDNRVSLDLFLAKLRVTDNSHVFLMDSANGILLSNSVKDSTYRISNYSDPSLPVIPYTPADTNDTYAREIGLFLRDRFGGYDKIPNENQTVTLETTIGKTEWIINY
ncbi:hypothetical protein HDU76_013744, partial [Blyttiomyces sp. JEL0837]